MTMKTHIFMTSDSVDTNSVNAGHVIAHKQFFDHAKAPNNFCLVSLNLPHTNVVILRSVFLRGPGIARSFILPSLQHVPHRNDSDTEEMRTRRPADCKHAINQLVIAPDGLYFSSFDLLLTDSVIPQPAFHNAPMIPITINVSTYTALDSPHPTVTKRSTSRFLSKLATVGIGTDGVRHFAFLAQRMHGINHQHIAGFVLPRRTDWDSRSDHVVNHERTPATMLR
jgi:hypothetical protein